MLGALAALVLFSTPATATRAGGPLVSVPVTLARHKVLVPVSVGGSRPLRLILDTGMGYDGVLLFDPRLRDSLGVGRWDQAAIGGAGGGSASSASLADSVSLAIGGRALGPQRVIVLGDTAMRGASDGVIGWSLLGHHAVEIDHAKATLTLRAPGTPPVGEDWTRLPVVLDEHQWPFLRVAVSVAGEPAESLLVYVDSASSETIEILTGPGRSREAPADAREVVLGRGLGGEIRGRRGTITSLRLGPHVLPGIEAAFVPAAIRSKARTADAVLAHGALERFALVFDLPNRAIFLRPESR